MNMSMADVTDLPKARRDDEVVIIGAQIDEEITAEEIAEKLAAGADINETVQIPGVIGLTPLILAIMLQDTKWLSSLLITTQMLILPMMTKKHL